MSNAQQISQLSSMLRAKDKVLKTYMGICKSKDVLISGYQQNKELLEEQNELLKKHLAKANPEYFKDLFGYYYDDVQDIRKKITEAGE